MAQTKQVVLVTTITATGAIVKNRFVNFKGAQAKAGETVLGVAPYDVETGDSGNTTVNGLLTYTAGLSAVNSGGGDAANIEGTMVVNGEIILNGIPLSKHKHPGDSGGKTGLPE